MKEVREHFRKNHFDLKTMKYIDKYGKRLKELKSNPNVKIISAGFYHSHWGWNRRIIYQFKK